MAIGDAGTQTTVLDASIANSDFDQSYPDSFTSGFTHPERTGAAESNTLGYPGWGDSVYHLTFPLSHSSSTLVVVFSDSGLQEPFDESWGLANVQVDITAVPEPLTGIAVTGAALLAFAAWRRRAK